MLKLLESDNKMITKAWLLNRRADKGPWLQRGREGGEHVNVYQVELGKRGGLYERLMVCSSYYKGHTAKGNVRANMEFIGESRMMIPELVDLASRLMKTVKYAEELIKTHPMGEDFVNKMQHIINGGEIDGIVDVVKNLGKEAEELPHVEW